MEERSGFKSNFGFLMAAVGSAVGLGNIWGFPHKMGNCGGFTFLLIYVMLGFTCGFIIMIGELAIGRKTGAGCVKAFQMVSKKFKWLGWIALASPFLILTFYCALGGYCVKYLVVNIGNLFGASFGSGGLGGADIFNAIMSNQVEMIIYGIIFVVLTLLIVLGGVSGGIEKVCAVGMPGLFLCLLICIIFACTLPGATDGLKFMFVPGWAAANVPDFVPKNIFQIIAIAGGQMFFSLSIGMGTMITYGSYLDKKENITKNGVIIVIMDSMVALMAGLVVLPARFALDPTGPIGGPGLLFVTMQNVFDRMGGLGPIFGIIFYALVIFAAVSSSISLLEAVTTHFNDAAMAKGKGNKHTKYAIIITILFGLGTVLVCADGLGTQGIAPKDLLGIDSSAAWCADWLDFFDMISEGIFMPLCGLFMSLMLGWETGTDIVKEEIESSPGVKFGAMKYFTFCCKFITPVWMLFILYGQVDSFFNITAFLQNLFA